MKITVIPQLVVTIGLASVLLLPTGLAAEEVGPKSGVAEQERVSHYSATKVTSAAEARSVFTRTLADIAKVIEDDATSMGELEQVHQLSYTLESSVEFLLKDAPTQELRSLSQAVEELHLATEKHDGKGSFAALEKIQTLKSVMETE